MVKVMAFSVALTGFIASDAWAQYKVVPWTFVGTADQCGVAGNKIVTSSWLGGMGLPDNGTAHPDGTQHFGLLLSKNGPTANCSSAGASVNGIGEGDPLTGLGFDFRRGGHCGAGAPRFNVYTSSDFSEYYFFGCASGVHTDSPQDAANWERVRFSSADGQPADPVQGPFVFGVTPVYAIEIVLDEGTDAPVAGPPGRSDLEGIGLAVLDNVLINNTLIRKKGQTAITP
jgi:hypothetical protein